MSEPPAAEPDFQTALYTDPGGQPPSSTPRRQRSVPTQLTAVQVTHKRSMWDYIVLLTAVIASGLTGAAIALWASGNDVVPVDSESAESLSVVAESVDEVSAGANEEAPSQEEALGTEPQEATEEEAAEEEAAEEEAAEEEAAEEEAAEEEAAEEEESAEGESQPAALPDDPQVAQWLTIEVPSNVERMSMPARRIEAQDLRIYARSLHGNGLHGRAEATWRQSLEYAPDHPSAIDGLSRSIARQGRIDEALAWANRAVELNAEDPRHYELLGELLEEKEDYAAAVAAYERGLALQPRNRRLQHRAARARRQAP